MPERIQLRRTKGWRLPEGAVVVARPGKWGNPWRIVPVRDQNFPWSDAADVINAARGTSIGRFERRTRGPRTGAPYWAVTQYRSDLLFGELAVTEDDVRRELAGRDLACWCRLDQPCHADVLLELANRTEP